MNIGNATVQRRSGGVYVVINVGDPLIISADQLVELSWRSFPPRWHEATAVLTLDTDALYRYRPIDGEDTTSGDVTMERIIDA